MLQLPPRLKHAMLTLIGNLTGLVAVVVGLSHPLAVQGLCLSGSTVCAGDRKRLLVASNLHLLVGCVPNAWRQLARTALLR